MSEITTSQFEVGQLYDFTFDGFSKQGLQYNGHAAFRDNVSEYVLGPGEDGTELRRIATRRKRVPAENNFGVPTDVSRSPVIDTEWPEKNIAGYNEANLQDGSLSDWFVGYGKKTTSRFEGSWYSIVRFAMRVLASPNTRLVTEEMSLGGIYQPDLSEKTGRVNRLACSITTEEDEWEETNLSAGKRTNLRYTGENRFVGYGKDRSCIFEGDWWSMMVFAMKVLSSPNTRRLTSDSNVAVYQESLRERAEELQIRCGTPYTYAPDGVDSWIVDPDDLVYADDDE